MKMDKKGMWKKRGEVATFVLIVAIAIFIFGFAIFNSNRGIANHGALPGGDEGDDVPGAYAPPIIPPNPGGQGTVECGMWNADGSQAGNLLDMAGWFQGNKYCAGHCIENNYCIPRRANCNTGAFQANGQCVKCDCENCGN